MIRAHQPGSEPIDIPETIPNPVVVPTPTPTEPAPKEPVRIPEKVPSSGVSTAQLYVWDAVDTEGEVPGHPRSTTARPQGGAQADGHLEKFLSGAHSFGIRTASLMPSAAAALKRRTTKIEDALFLEARYVRP